MFSKGQGGTFTAVDFDARRVRVVQLDVGGKKPRVRKMHSEPMPATVSLSDPQAVGALIGKVLKQLRLGAGAGGILMNVSRGQAVLKPLNLPHVDSHDELPGMVRYQVEKELPFSGEQAVIDFALENHFDAEKSATSSSDGSDGSMELLVAAVHQKVVAHYLAIAEAAGVKLRRLGLRPYANMCCIEACQVVEPGHKVAVIHIAAEETQIDIFTDQSVAFSRAAAVKVAGARSQACGDPGPPPLPTAEEKAFESKLDSLLEPESEDLRENGGKSGGKRKHAAGEATDAVEQVVTEVTRSLKSYHAVQRGQGIRKILVAGDTGIEAQVVERLAQAFDTPCARFSPASGIDLGGKEGEDASAYISAFGLAIGQGGRDTVPFDFLNPKRPVRRVDPVKRKLMIAGAAASVLLVATIGWTATHILGERAELDALIGEVNDLKTQVRQGGSMVNRVGAVEKWHDGQRHWLEHWTKVSALFPAANEAYITGMRSSSDNHINITLRSRSGEAITAMGERLSEAGYAFSLGRITTVTDPHGYGYNATLAVMIDPKMELKLDELPPVERPSDDASLQILSGATRRVTTETSSRPARSGGNDVERSGQNSDDGAARPAREREEGPRVAPSREREEADPRRAPQPRGGFRERGRS
jgi:Tfp pilus assembly PilM family ATPase